MLNRAVGNSELLTATLEYDRKVGNTVKWYNYTISNLIDFRFNNLIASKKKNNNRIFHVKLLPKLQMFPLKLYQWNYRVNFARCEISSAIRCSTVWLEILLELFTNVHFSLYTQ